MRPRFLSGIDRRPCCSATGRILQERQRGLPEPPLVQPRNWWPPAGCRSYGSPAVPAAAARVLPCTARLPSATPPPRYAIRALLPEARGPRLSWLLHRLIAQIVVPTKGPLPESNQERSPSAETI